MKSLLGFAEYLEERLVTFGKKAYPKYGNFIILAGGAGSGKGWVIKNLLGIDAKIVDVDAVKQLAQMAPLIQKRLAQIMGKPTSEIDMRNPKDVSNLHIALDQIMGIIPKKDALLKTALLQTDKSRLPNIIFDTTLKEFSRFENLTAYAKMAGYPPENIHVVWVINDVEVAKEQNSKRSRVVPENILISTHEGASVTLKTIYDLSSSVTNYMNGDIWFVLNNKEKDVTTKISPSGGSYVSDASYIRIKNSGSASMNPIPKEFIEKIRQYTPKTKGW